MKTLFSYLLIIFTFILSPWAVSAQINVSIKECNTIHATYFMNATISSSDCVFVLEKMILPGIWNSKVKQFKQFTEVDFSGLSAGFYRVKLVSRSSITTLTSREAVLFESKIIEVRNCSLEKENNSLPVYTIKIFPNPASDVISVEASPLEGSEYFVIYDISGRKISASLLSENLILPINQMLPGLYFGFLEKDGICLIREKFVIR